MSGAQRPPRGRDRGGNDDDTGAGAAGVLAAGAADTPWTADASPASFLDPRGPFAVLGGGAADTLVQPLAVRADTLFGPRGVALGPAGMPLAVCDTGHHRLLLWRTLPERDGAPADLVIGQAGFTAEGRNGGGRPGPATFNVPTGVAVERSLLAVADPWNHRVLLWHRLPERSNAPADVVLGQAGFGDAEPNRGSPSAGPDTLNWCYGVALAGASLVVADTGNRRVLIWHRVPTVNGQPADLVLGQRDFACRDENAGGVEPRLGMRWPHAIAAAAGGLQVADAGHSRILVWRRFPAASAALPDLVLGQQDFTAFDPNAGRPAPSAATLNLPYGLAAIGAIGAAGAAGGWLIAADTANSRLLAWHTSSLATGAAAAGLAGQHGFVSRGDNRWQPAARDSLCWPTAVAARDGLPPILAIADTGNNRVLLWRLRAA